MENLAVKPRIRVQAGSMRTSDSVQNFVARVGLGTANQASGTAYGPSPITRNRLQLEWAYRGSWICRQIVDAPPEDMTRAGIDIETKEPKDGKTLQTALQRTATWTKLRETLQWSRLYGGGVAIILIKDQDPATPLRPETVGKGAYQGLLPLDRWSVQPSMTDVVTEYGPSFGLPKFYSVIASVLNIPRMKVHHSRVLRFEGEDLPIWQKMAENGWGLSVLEPVWDRLTAFDSTTVGTGQLVYKAHLRTLRIDGLREALATDGPAIKGILKNVDMIRALQTNEGLTLLDKLDEFATHQYSFGGLSDILIQFAQQLSGAAQIPLVRLFGQSPAGLNATGDADIRNYYDACKSQQENRLRTPMGTLLEVMHWSELQRAPDPEFEFTFRPLWQMSDKEKGEIGASVANTVSTLEGAAIINRATALKELRQASHVTGMFTSITDQDIEDAENEPPPPSEGDDLPEPPAPDKDGADRGDKTETDPDADSDGTGEARDGAKARPGARDAGNFDPSQPREENGQFAEGSGGQAAKAEKSFAGPAEAKAALKDWKANSPFKSIDDLVNASPKNQERLVGAAATVAQETGAAFRNPGAKTEESARRKFESKGYQSAGEMTDLARGGFVAKTPQQADAVVAALRKHFDVIDEGWSQAPTGYIDRKVLVRFDDGQVGEVQIWEPNLLQAKREGGGHKLYDEWRQIGPNNPALKSKRTALEAKQRKLYAAAAERADPAWASVLPGKGGKPG
ncbi:MAG: DUF1073 domain-containing protein [Bradyrhizobium sp.]|nr:DUF1073 domain-containing protein [Bradyrhizobium sp.]